MEFTWEFVGVIAAIGGTILGFSIAMWRCCRSSSNEASETTKVVGRVEGKVDGMNASFQNTQETCHRRMELTERRLDTSEKRITQNETRLAAAEKRLDLAENRLTKLEKRRGKKA